METSLTQIPSDWYQRVVDTLNLYAPHRLPEIVPDWREGKTGIRLEIPERQWAMVVMLHDNGCEIGYDLISAEYGDFIDGSLIPSVPAQADYNSIASAILSEIRREIQTRSI